MRCIKTNKQKTQDISDTVFLNNTNIFENLNEI